MFVVKYGVLLVDYIEYLVDSDIFFFVKSEMVVVLLFGVFYYLSEV